jgi:hypothetical protein
VGVAAVEQEWVAAAPDHPWATWAVAGGDLRWAAAPGRKCRGRHKWQIVPPWGTHKEVLVDLPDPEAWGRLIRQEVDPVLRGRAMLAAATSPIAQTCVHPQTLVPQPDHHYPAAADSQAGIARRRFRQITDPAWEIAQALIIVPEVLEESAASTIDPGVLEESVELETVQESITDLAVLEELAAQEG